MNDYSRAAEISPTSRTQAYFSYDRYVSWNSKDITLTRLLMYHRYRYRYRSSNACSSPYARNMTAKDKGHSTQLFTSRLIPDTNTDTSFRFETAFSRFIRVCWTHSNDRATKPAHVRYNSSAFITLSTHRLLIIRFYSCVVLYMYGAYRNSSARTLGSFSLGTSR